MQKINLDNRVQCRHSVVVMKNVTRNQIAKQIKIERKEVSFAQFVAMHPKTLGYGVWKYSCTISGWQGFVTERAMASFGEHENLAWKLACRNPDAKEITHTPTIADLASEQFRKQNEKRFGIGPVAKVEHLGMEIEVPVKSEWDIADASGAAGDPSPGIDYLVKIRAMQNVWRRLEQRFPQIGKIGGWRLQYRDRINQWIAKRQKDGLDVGGQFGPCNREQWLNLAVCVLECRNDWNGGRA